MRKILVGARVSMDGVMQEPMGQSEAFKLGGWGRPYQDQDCWEEFDRLFFSEKLDLLLGPQNLQDFRGVLAVPSLGRRSQRRPPEALQGDQEVRGFALGRHRYELAGPRYRVYYRVRNWMSQEPTGPLTPTKLWAERS